MPVPEPHHPLRANGPFERLCLPLPSLEALWGHACLRLTRLVAPGTFSFCICCESFSMLVFVLLAWIPQVV